MNDLLSILSRYCTSSASLVNGVTGPAGSLSHIPDPDRYYNTGTHPLIRHRRVPLKGTLRLARITKELLIGLSLEAFAPPHLVVLRRALVVVWQYGQDRAGEGVLAGLEVPDEHKDTVGFQVLAKFPLSISC